MTWNSERELLAEMDTWTPLPSEDDPRWDIDGDRWGDAWADADRLIEAAYASGVEQWRTAAVRVFEFAADWDLHGQMQSIRHGPEQAFVESGQDFADRLLPLAAHTRPGTRLWVVRELGILRELSSLPMLVERVGDSHADVAQEAWSSIGMLGQVHAAARAQLRWLPDPSTGVVTPVAD